MTNREKEKLINIICEKYDTEEDDKSGCCYNGRWFSIADICEIIRNADV